MADSAKFEDAERRFVGLVREAGLPEPDEVNYRVRDNDVEFVWHEQKLVVVVDCAPNGAAPG